MVPNQVRTKGNAAMRIYQTVTRIPGGLMVVPLFTGMVINTFFPHLLKIGGFTQALSEVGYPTILGMYLFTVGTKMTLRTAPRMLKRGFGIMFAKVGLATLIAVSVGKFFGGNIWGYSTLALLVAMSDTNGGMFMALTSVMGDKEDAGTYVPQSIETGPFLTMVILVGAGLANIPWLTIVSVIAPIAAGAVFGNLDKDLREFFGSHEPIIVPFMGFTLGQTINLSAVVTAGLPGVALGVFVLVVTGIVCILADLLLGGSGIAGAAASSTAGNSAAVPKAVAMADPSYAAVAPAATVQVAASVIVTAVLTPILTSFVYKWVQRRRAVAAVTAALQKAPAMAGATMDARPREGSL
jgi:2-keto-3-deoxygluconate permease